MEFSHGDYKPNPGTLQVYNATHPILSYINFDQIPLLNPTYLQYWDVNSSVPNSDIILAIDGNRSKAVLFTYNNIVVCGLDFSYNNRKIYQNPTEMYRHVGGAPDGWPYSQQLYSNMLYWAAGAPISDYKDIQSPGITNVTYDSQPYVSTPLLVTANIYDYSDISSVVLYYQVHNIYTGQVNMTKGAGTLYSASIDFLAQMRVPMNGQFWITAKDQNGLISTSLTYNFSTRENTTKTDFPEIGPHNATIGGVEYRTSLDFVEKTFQRFLDVLENPKDNAPLFITLIVTIFGIVGFIKLKKSSGMTCPTCSAPISPNTKFCIVCGAQLKDTKLTEENIFPGLSKAEKEIEEIEETEKEESKKEEEKSDNFFGELSSKKAKTELDLAIEESIEELKKRSKK